jgi:hypothetical protein
VWGSVGEDMRCTVKLSNMGESADQDAYQAAVFRKRLILTGTPSAVARMRTRVARTRQRIRDSGLGSAAGLLRHLGCSRSLSAFIYCSRGPTPANSPGAPPPGEDRPPARLLLTRALLDSAKCPAPVTGYVLSAAPGRRPDLRAGVGTRASGRGWGPGRNQVMLTSDPDHPGGQFHSSKGLRP